MTILKSFVISLIIVSLAACSSLGLATPKGFDQQLAEAYGVHTAVVKATTTALQAGSISVKEAEIVSQQEGGVRRLLDVAKAAEVGGDMNGARSNLTLALTGLTALQSYLNSRGK